MRPQADSRQWLQRAQVKNPLQEVEIIDNGQDVRI